MSFLSIIKEKWILNLQVLAARFTLGVATYFPGLVQNTEVKEHHFKGITLKAVIPNINQLHITEPCLATQ
jgi:hypothetical protein